MWLPVFLIFYFLQPWWCRTYKQNLQGQKFKLKESSEKHTHAHIHTPHVDQTLTHTYTPTSHMCVVDSHRVSRMQIIRDTAVLLIDKGLLPMMRETPRL